VQKDFCNNIRQSRPTHRSKRLYSITSSGPVMSVGGTVKIGGAARLGLSALAARQPHRKDRPVLPENHIRT
jgi:hypothetical protein